MSTVLAIVQDALAEMALAPVTSLVGAAGEAERQLLAAALLAGKEIRGACRWPQLQREFTFALVENDPSYPLPEDMDRFVFDTLWNRTKQWPLQGPMTTQEWQTLTSGITAPSVRHRFTVSGWKTDQFHISPTPDAGDAGSIVAFNYQSKTWLRPLTWAAGQVIAATGVYRSYDGRIYVSASTGTTGGDTVEHTTGTESDGAVNWTYVTAAYERILADTDVPLLDEEELKEGLKWRYMKTKGIPGWESIKVESESKLRSSAIALKGAETLRLVPGFPHQGFGPWSIPETGHGGV